MTVREYLHRRKFKMIAVIFPQWVLLATLVMVGDRILSVQQTIIGLVSVFALFIASVALLHRKALCPKCSYNFYYLSVRKRKRSQVDFCPGCALQLDTEYQ